SVHNSSSMIGLAISSVSVVPMPEVNSSPRKLTAPRGLFETVSYEHFRAERVYGDLCAAIEARRPVGTLEERNG
ncbi:hypothetical protein, partial [Burkholderia cenocepacia]|uniref:hypothetical protein n=1 Tax=Burkholderia cenocepacia TaxID=95486 RepID=UPI001C23E17E